VAVKDRITKGNVVKYDLCHDLYPERYALGACAVKP
jgi:hypothetical protein